MTTLHVGTTNYPLSSPKSLNEWKKKQKQWILKAQQKNTELLIFPEYASLEICSFLKNTQIKKQLQEFQTLIPEFINFYSECATQYNLTILAPTYPLLKNDGCYNCADVFFPNSKILTQRKKRITPFEKVAWNIQPSLENFVVFEINTFKCAILICYDCEFPQHTLDLLNKDIDLLLIPSCTEAQSGLERVHIGARARSLELQCYAAVSQVIGKSTACKAIDLNTGKAALYCPPDHRTKISGVLAESKTNSASLVTYKLDKKVLEHQRKKPEVYLLEDQRQS